MQIIASITLEKINKVYPNGLEAVHNLDLSVKDGEFMVLVGPSGCGKTTLLRMVAGLEEVSEGTLYFGDRKVNDDSPRDRDVAMVFQNYALYPHMSVAQNIGFALKMQKMSKEEIQRRVANAAGILGITDWLNKKPGQLSGGQRQRVAMGRAIVREPSVFLMDEPLSNLDAKLRVQLRADILQIQRRIGVATLYVTHDQTEALTMGDRVAVLRDGHLLQCATPQQLYEQPSGLFVATFIGSPAMNLFEGTFSSDAATLTVGSARLEVPDEVRQLRPALSRYANRTVVVGIRPENLFTNNAVGHNSSLDGRVSLVEALGSEQVVHFTIDAKRVRAEGGLEDEESSSQQIGLSVEGGGIARLGPKLHITVDERIKLHVDMAEAHFFDLETGASIWN